MTFHADVLRHRWVVIGMARSIAEAHKNSKLYVNTGYAEMGCRQSLSSRRNQSTAVGMDWNDEKAEKNDDGDHVRIFLVVTRVTFDD